MMPLSLCFALNKQMRLVYLIVPAVLFNFIVNYSFVRMGWGINGVAVGSSLSYFLATTMLFYYTLRLFQERKTQLLKFILLICVPFIYSAIIIYILERFMPTMAGNIWIDMFYSILNILIFSVSYSLIFIPFRNHPAFSKLIRNIPLLAKIKGEIST